MSQDVDVLTGLAQTLHDAAAAVYRPASPYLAGETAVVFGDMPDTPDRCVTLTLYGPSDDHPDQPLGVRRVQVRSRGLPGDYLDAVALDDACFQALHGLTHAQWGATHANQVLRASGAPLGQDPAQRWDISSNYVLDVDTPATALRHQ